MQLPAKCLVVSCALVGVIAPATAAYAADTVKPVSTISLNIVNPNGTSGWYRTGVTAKVVVTDSGTPVSGVAEVRCVLDPVTAPATFAAIPAGCAFTGAGAAVTSDGAHALYAASRDNAGNIEVVKVKTFKIDKTAPVATVSITSGTLGDNGWYVSSVTAATTGTDNLSGIASCTAASTTTSETIGKTYTGTCKDAAGNTSAAASVTFKIDKTAPSVWVRVTPGALWPPNGQMVDVSAVMSVTDARSGSGGFAVTAVTSSDPTDGDDIEGFDFGAADTTGQLRAQRAGTGDGRFYTLTYVGRDMAGNTASTYAVVTVGHDGRNTSRRAAMTAGADRLIELQRTDANWEGTWFWYVGNTVNVTNMNGINALGLIEAYRDTHDQAYLDATKGAAAFAMAHLGAGATGVKHNVRMGAADIAMLHLLADATGDVSYATRAAAEWQNIKTFWPTAGALDARFRATKRRLGAWDLAAFLEAAKMSGDDVWAGEAAAILAATDDPFYYEPANVWYPLTITGALRALAGNGYAAQYEDAVATLLDQTINMISVDNVDGGVQTTAYAVLALRAVGGSAERYANDMARWLASMQSENGGWVEGGLEITEYNAEAVRALGETLGAGVRIKGVTPNPAPSGAWTSNGARGRAHAFDEQ